MKKECCNGTEYENHRMHVPLMHLTVKQHKKEILPNFRAQKCTVYLGTQIYM